MLARGRALLIHGMNQVYAMRGVADQLSDVFVSGFYLACNRGSLHY
jgi:hypothetical protein